MDENNVFNSFSFQKWADYVRKEKIENEILRQRMEQVTRLRTKLVRERHLRDQADMLTDEDIDKVIGYLSAGHSLNGSNLPLNLGVSGNAGTSRNFNNKTTTSKAVSTSSNNKLSEGVSTYAPKDDDYIFNEIKQFYAKTHSFNGLHGTIPIRFKYNHRCDRDGYENPLPKAVNPKSRFFKFEYNKRYGNDFE